MSDMLTERTPFVIAAEINIIKYQTEKVVLNNAVEIGRRLTEARALVPYGEWRKWLEDEVNFTQRTAQNLIRIYEEYVGKQLATLNAGAPARELPNLGYTQALILLGIPEEERAQFIDDLDIESMTTRELKKAVDERMQAQQERDRAEQENTDLQKALDDEKGKTTRLTEERNNLKTKANELQRSKQALEHNFEKKQMEYDKLKERTGYKNIQRMTNNLNVAYKKVAANKIAFLYESLDKTFKELAYEMGRFAPLDPDAHAAYKKMVNDFLIKAMKERMGG